MAVMGKEVYHSKRGGIVHEYQVKFSKKLKMFFASVPSEFEIVRDESQSWTGEVYGNTYDDLTRSFYELADKYYSTSLICEKVIVYKVPVNNPSHYGNAQIRADMSYSPKLAIGVEYSIKYKITMGDRILISHDKFDNLQDRHTMSTADDDYDEIGRLKSKGWTITAHTDELENWFLSFENKLIDFVTSVESFFGESDQMLLDNIKSLPEFKMLEMAKDESSD